MVGPAVIAAGLAWWAGLHLLARDPGKPVLRRTAAGLLGYAVALVPVALGTLPVDGSLPTGPGRIQLALLVVPAVAWTGVVLALLPPGAGRRAALDRAWSRGLVPVAAAVAVGAALLGGPPAYLALAVVALGPLGFALALLVAVRDRLRPGGVGGVLLLATVFFALGAAVVLLPLGLVPAGLGLLTISVDFTLLAGLVAVTDAFDEGEALRADMLRSLLGAAVVALLFGGQVALAGWLGAGWGRGTVGLLLGVVGAAIAVQVLARPLGALLDRLAFPRRAQLRADRAELRDAVDAVPRRPEADALAALDDDEFARLVRRALSHYGDLGRLVGSPLVWLPAVDTRLRERGAADQPLERATELKALLRAGIERLRPRAAGDERFGSTDEWRHFNALYFPYVAGLRPYAQRARQHGLDEPSRRALQWFARTVPERTLHNWQRAAARLVAEDLRTGSGGSGATSRRFASELDATGPG